MKSKISEISRDYNQAKSAFKACKMHLNGLRRRKITADVIAEMAKVRIAMMNWRKDMIQLRQQNRDLFMKQAAATAERFNVSNKILPAGNFTVNYTSALELLRCLTDYCKKMQQVPAESRVKAVISFKSV